MNRLYNEFLALNREGDQVFNNVFHASIKLARECHENDLDLRDARQVALDAVNTAFSEIIQSRAASMLQSMKAPEGYGKGGQ